METFERCKECKYRTEIPPLQNVQDGVVNIKLSYSDIDKVESLNNCFATLSSTHNNEPTLPRFILFCNKSFDKIVITEQDVIDIISMLPVNKAIGPDDISHKMLKATIFFCINPSVSIV